MEKHAIMSFDEKRAALLKAAKQQGPRGVSKQVYFENEEIPEFLQQYQAYQKTSRETIILTH